MLGSCFGKNVYKYWKKGRETVEDEDEQYMFEELKSLDEVIKSVNDLI